MTLRQKVMLVIMSKLLVPWLLWVVICMDWWWCLGDCLVWRKKEKEEKKENKHCDKSHDGYVVLWFSWSWPYIGDLGDDDWCLYEGSSHI